MAVRGEATVAFDERQDPGLASDCPPPSAPAAVCCEGKQT
ncbi:Protein of unknown function [Gryllus bimaculatus]|nr:Protein of unknown function [Gryllus bimaculatus]